MSSDAGNRPVRITFMRHAGPLRSRLPSFEPVTSPDEDKWATASLLNNRNRASTETSYTEEFDRSTTSMNGDETEEGKEAHDFSFFGCDPLFSTVLSTCV
jgi:hypothetical protein